MAKSQRKKHPLGNKETQARKKEKACAKGKKPLPDLHNKVGQSVAVKESLKKQGHP